jgi:hypothetical protein
MPVRASCWRESPDTAGRKPEALLCGESRATTFPPKGRRRRSASGFWPLVHQLRSPPTAMITEINERLRDNGLIEGRD